MSSTDSDDDLPSILQHRSPLKIQPIKSTDQILTPRRSIKPDHDENNIPEDVADPQSPLVTSPVAKRRGVGNRRQVSMSDLLKEKKHDNEIKNKVIDILNMEGIMVL